MVAIGCLVGAAALAFEDAVAGPLPDGRPGRGVNDVALAWLAAPTARYAHGVLGDAVVSFAGRQPRELRRIPLPAPAAGNFKPDAGMLSVPLADGRRHRLRF